MKSILNIALIVIGVLLLSCSKADNSHTVIELAGCTPGDELIKSLLTIQPEKKVDFIRWNLSLNHSNVKKNRFKIDIEFGESQPNTLGFKNNSVRLHFEGEYHISENQTGGIMGEVITLISNKLPSEIKLVKLNDNLFHLLTPDNQLMIGNGGWSYTLNSKIIHPDIEGLPALTDPSVILNDTSQMVIFEGRTPCQEFAAEHNWKVSPECFKLKWKLTLNRDPVSHMPATYSIRKVIDNVPSDITGNWTLVKGTSQNPNALIYQLNYDNPLETISLLAGDENVLFFLHKDQQLIVGNENFSFTLNKRTSAANSN